MFFEGWGGGGGGGYVCHCVYHIIGACKERERETWGGGGIERECGVFVNVCVWCVHALLYSVCVWHMNVFVCVRERERESKT